MTLHYKSERALPFNKFLDQLNKMFAIFDEEAEPLSERAKVDELLTKVQNPALSAAVAQLRFQLNTEGVTFTVASNHLNSAVAQTPEYQITRQVGATNTDTRQHGGRGGRGGRGRGGRGGRGGSGRYGSGRSEPPSWNIRKKGGTGFYSPEQWNKLSYQERAEIRQERDQKGEPGGTNKRSVSEMSTEQWTQIISAVNNNNHDTNSVDTPTTSNHSGSNAGYAFGGKDAAKRSRNT